MTKVKEIMTKDVLVVNPETSVSMAVKIIAIKKVSGLPVVDDQKNLLGIITEADLMHLLLEKGDISKKMVGELMTKDVKCFGPDNDAFELCQFLMDNPFRRVPIVSGTKLVGVVSRPDIISLLWRERFSNQ